MASRSSRRSSRRSSAVRAGGALGISAIAAIAVAAPASALNYVTNQNGDSWAVSDAAIPGLDTGSVHNTSTGSLQGFGGLRVQVSGGPKERMDGVLLRGFGLRFDGVNRFETTKAVELGGVAITRAILIDRASSWARFLDSFTNTTKQAVTIEVAFGGQLGYGSAAGATGRSNQSAIATTSSGDQSITPADGWVEVANPSTLAGEAGRTNNGPVGVVLGTPGSGNLTRTGNFLVDPFSVPLAAGGEQANHVGFVNRLTIQPGQTRSIARFVVTGLSETRPLTSGAAIPAAGSQVAAVAATASALTAAPAFSDLSTAQLCAIANWNVSTLVTSADCTPARTPEVTVPLAAEPEPVTSSPYDVTGKSLTELQADMESGKTTSQEITRAYLDRIAAYDGGPFGFHSVITVAKDAMAQAKIADISRANGIKGPLLGIPILAKDIYDTKDMPTTGGSLVFDGYQPTKDAFQVAKLREAGAIILGKANLAEFATDGHFSPSAYGQVWNAFDASKSSIGSSGGSAVSVATSMAAAALGTQTGDSLWGPSSAASLVSLRGTDGMQSADGVMPLTFIQDYAGTIARTIPDLAALLQATAVPNPSDPLTHEADAHRPASWSAYLKDDALKGKTIGVPATAFDDPFGTTGTSDAMRAQFAHFTTAGATVKAIPDPPPAPTGVPGDRGYEGWRRWILDHPNNPYSDVPQITLNQKRVPLFRSTATTYTGTGPMTDAEVQGFIDYRKRYRAILAQWMDDNGVDAVAFPGELSDIHLNDSIQPSFGRRDPQSSAAGVPTVIFPAGRNDHGQPINLQLQGREFSDPELLGYAYAFEQVAKGKVETALTPPLKYVEGSKPQPIVVTPAAPPVTSPPPGSPTPISEAPSVPAKAGRVTVVSSSLRATSRGRFSVKLACSKGASSSCRVRVTIRRGGVALSRTTVTIASGRTRTVAFTAPRAVRRILARGSKATLLVSLSGRGGTTVAKARKVSLRGPR